METKPIKDIICPNCGSANLPLRPACKTCGLRLVEIQAGRRRVTQLEQGALAFLSQKAYYDAFRAFAVLLEYKPGLPRFQKGLCKALLGLNAKKEAEKIFRQFEGKLKNDPELDQIRQELAPAQDDSPRQSI